LERAEKVFPRFCAGTDSFSVKRAYGSTSTRCDAIQKAKFLSSSGLIIIDIVDVEKKKELEQELLNCHEKKNEIISNLRMIDAEENNYRSKFDGFNNELVYQ
jgi:hypothetical protein